MQTVPRRSSRIKNAESQNEEPEMQQNSIKPIKKQRNSNKKRKQN